MDSSAGLARRRERSHRGAAMLEFAIILPILLLLVMGIIQFGRAYNIVVSLQGAAREGARALALCNTSTPCAGVDAAVTSATATSISSITQTPCTAAGGQARVQATRAFEIGIPFIPSVTVTLRGDASMRCGL